MVLDDMDNEENTLLLFDTEKAAKLLCLKKTYLESLRCKGGGPRFVYVGKYVRYSHDDLICWVASRNRFDNTIQQSLR